MEPAQPFDAPEALLTPGDVGRVLGVPVSTLANWRWAGTGPAFLRVCRHVRYRPVDLTAWTEAQVEAAVPDRAPR